MTVNPLHNHLNIRICDDAQDAIQQGFNWVVHPTPPKPVEITQVVIIRKGTENGNPTVDFVMKDDTGQRYVFMITGALLRALPIGDIK